MPYTKGQSSNDIFLHLVACAVSTNLQKYPRTPHLPFSPGVSADDVVLPYTNSADLPILSQETVLTEKLDGGNCSIYKGKVGQC